MDIVIRELEVETLIGSMTGTGSKTGCKPRFGDGIDIQQAAKSDDKDTLDYKAVSNGGCFISGSEFLLVEAMAEQV